VQAPPLAALVRALRKHDTSAVLRTLYRCAFPIAALLWQVLPRPESTD